MQRSVAVSKTAVWFLGEGTSWAAAFPMSMEATQREKLAFATYHGKARLVYPGNRYKYGSSGDLAATVLRWDVAKLMMLMATHNDEEIESCDANAAFMNRKNNTEEYCFPPEGYPCPPGTALRIDAMFYGKENAPKAWQEIRDDHMTEINYETSKHNDCLFTLKTDDPNRSHRVGILVDDYLTTGDKLSTKEFNEKIAAKWSMKMYGDISGREFMGVRVTRDRKKRIIKFDQERAILDFLKLWGCENVKGRETPMDANLKLPKMDGVCKDRKLQTEFRSKIGSMLQFARFTRPDILYPVIYLSTFQSHPAKIHMDAADELMRYLKHTMSHKMTHDCSVDIKTAVYMSVDANWDVVSWAGGNISVFGGSWAAWSKKINLVMHSSTASEYFAIDLGAREMTYLRNMLMDDFGIKLPVTPVLEDNQSAIAIANGPTQHSRTKHMDIRLHYIRERIKMGQLRMQYHPTEHMPSDVQTKSLTRKMHQRHANVLMGVAAVRGLTQSLY